MVKKGVFFSIDALIALLFILSFIAFSSYFHINKQATTQPVYYSSDLVQILSNIRLNELNRTDIISFLENNSVNDKNRTIIEQALRFQVEGNPNAAEDLLSMTIGSLVPSNYNAGVWIEGYSDPIYATSLESSTQLISSKQMISGIEKGKAVEGLSSRVFLSNINKMGKSAFVYFGGYEGDGNITRYVFLPNNSVSVDSVYMEADSGSDFSMYINGFFSGTYNSTGINQSADRWNINNSYLINFHSSLNTISLKFSQANRSYIGGGYIKIDYSSSEIGYYEESGKKTEYLPGINGIINLYDSFYVPGILSNMNIHLHYLSNYNIYLIIGNTTIINQTPSGENSIEINNSQISSLLNYSLISKQTVPLRIGIGKPPGGEGPQQTGVDVVLITDLSDSMNSRLDNDNTGVSRSNCSDPQMYNSSTKRVSIAKCLDKTFVEAILNNTNNRVALSAFYGDSGPPYKGRVYEVSLTNNASYLKGKIDLYSPQGGTCICCAINDAYKILNEQSSSLRAKFVIVMSDGIPTHTCQAASGCTGTRTGLQSEEGLWLGGACYGGIDDCASNDCTCATTNANWSSCRVHNALDAIVHSIGFGPVATCAAANKTLRAVASCGEGNYYVSDNATVLAEFYKNISSEILKLGYSEQTAVPLGSVSNTILYPDSYISLSYTPELPQQVYGRIPVTAETPRFNNEITQGNFTIPSGVIVYEAKAISYSGEKWTDKARIQNSQSHNFYNLSRYGSNYYMLGDPYSLNIPVQYIEEGENMILIGTGTSPVNSTKGSKDDKVIYTIGIDLNINYSGVFEKAEGCDWDVRFEDNTSAIISVPSSYNGTNNCSFNSATNCAAEYDDAINNVFCNLLDQLDFDNDGSSFIKFGSGDLSVETFSIGKIPYMWGPTVAEVRVWR